jgi:uncharacterized membrane protein YeaQ/YmgE (transglycosylase-associated protein family)
MARVYVSAAIMLAVMTLVLRVTLPLEAPKPHVRYRELVTSSFTLLATYRELRRRAWLGGVNFAAFSALWTTLAFELSGPPFHFSSGRIGLFALLGIAGSLVGTWAGQLLGWYAPGEPAGFIASVVGAMLLLLLHRIASRQA